MITREKNDQLTKVGPDPLTGNLMRRYWHPVASAAPLEEKPIVPVEPLWEQLVVFRDGTGELGLIEWPGGATNVAPYHDVFGKDESGLFRIATANGQGHIAVATQGATVDCHRERLSATDADLIMYRQVLLDRARLLIDGGDLMSIHHYGPSKKQIDPSNGYRAQRSDRTMPTSASGIPPAYADGRPA